MVRLKILEERERELTTFCTDLTMLKEGESELSPVAFAITATRRCVSATYINGSMMMQICNY